ncbi:MAG TPA: response regulator transcription factor [Bacteroidia bacterium]
MNSKFNKILIVDDEPDILEFLKYNLNKEGFDTYTAQKGQDAFDIAEKIKPNLVLLDIMMPDMDGVEVCRMLRESEKFQNTIIAFLTARNEDYSQIAGFESGADDYIAKPVKLQVLVSRINALLKRFSYPLQPAAEKHTIPKSISLDKITIDIEKYVLLKGNKTILLPKKEFELIALLMSKPGRVFTRDEILNEIWGVNIVVESRTVDVHVSKLREKLGETYIKTIIGIGYKFVY